MTRGFSGNDKIWTHFSLSRLKEIPALVYNSGTISLSKKGVGGAAPRRYLRVDAVLVPHVHDVAVPRYVEHLVGRILFEVHFPVPPRDGVEGVDRVHPEALARLVQHVFGEALAANFLQESSYNTGTVIAPVVALEVLAQVVEAAAGKVVPQPLGAEAEHTGGDVAVRLGAGVVRR